MKRIIQRKPAALAALALVTLLGSVQAADRKTYIVQLKSEPAATYQGGVSGLAATQVQPGRQFNLYAPEVQAYLSYLNNKQNTVASLVGADRVLQRYDTVFNGFSASLTEAEVRALRASPEVAEIFVDEPRTLDTVSTHRFLKLSTDGGVWSKSVGGSAIKGENMVIGIVDSGVSPENPAFADRVDANGKPSFDGAANLAYGAPPASWKGSCDSGEGFDAAKHCNNKLIGARAFDAGFKAFVAGSKGVNPVHWSEFASVRDSVGSVRGGHGTHTASTAGGNEQAPVTMGGIPMGDAGGVAPRARIAAYKVCWTYVDPAGTDPEKSRNGCWPSDSVAAIDQAVKDGVNVINFSISGSQDSSADPVEQAFYRASLAGVFVAASAGNSGPANQVAHISPWLTTVAASAHDRNFQADAKLANGAKYSGASNNTVSLPASALIRAEDAGLGGGAANLCYSDAAAAALNKNDETPAPQVLLDPDKVAGKIVICTRGNNARVDKSLAVLNAGGVGMIMADNGAGLVSELHSVPTVHITQADGNAVKTYAVTAGSDAKAEITAFYAGTKPAPIMAGFSSRGPNKGDPNILKPDLTAPGVDVIAGVSPAMTRAQRDAVAAGGAAAAAWASYQGTSMSSPHVAGMAALLKQANPTWSPAAIKSALMTTAYTTLTDGLPAPQTGTLPWAQGAGHTDPLKALNPGLVYDAGKADYVRYQCKVNKASVPASDCTTFGTLDETYNLNLPSITVGSVVVSATVNRKVTNVGDSTATYAGTVNVPGFSAVLTPSSLTLAPGETKSFALKLTPDAKTASNVWQFGSLSWTDGSRVVRSPVQARVGKLITAPAGYTDTRASGSKLFSVQTGFVGRMTAARGGLKAAEQLAAVSLAPKATSSAQLRTACAAGVDTASVKVHAVSIPANTTVARFDIRQQDTNSADADFDMIMLDAAGNQLVYSGADGTNEAVQVSSPAAGNYRVCVVAYGGPASMSYRMSQWVVTTADVGGKFNAMLPSTVYAGGTASVGLSWSGLEQGKRYLGAVQFRDLNGATQATTVLRVEPNGGLPLSEPAPTAARKMSDMGL